MHPFLYILLEDVILREANRMDERAVDTHKPRQVVFLLMVDAYTYYRNRAYRLRAFNAE